MTIAPKPIDDRTDKSGQVELEVVAVVCAAGECPTVYKASDDSIFVQGYLVGRAEAGIEIPSGEVLVSIPADLLGMAMRALEGNGR